MGNNPDKLFSGKIFLPDCAGGPFIIQFRNEAEGRIKFVQGPHLAPGPDFGHHWYKMSFFFFKIFFWRIFSLLFIDTGVSVKWGEDGGMTCGK